MHTCICRVLYTRLYDYRAFIPYTGQVHSQLDGHPLLYMHMARRRQSSLEPVARSLSINGGLRSPRNSGHRLFWI